MLELKHITKTFDTDAGRVKAVDDVSLTINPGEIFGIIGFSGAGKSTLVRCINLLERPTSGNVVIDGTDLTTLSDADLRVVRRRIGMIFQHFNLMPSRTVFDNIALALRHSELDKNAKAKKIEELLALVGLSDKLNAYPAQLSGGQKQRVAIARALANDPKVLLCDEATSALDPQTTHSILKLLKEVNQKLKLTIVVITHQMSVIKEICDRVAVMKTGRIVEEGSITDIFAHPKADLTKEFINTANNVKKFLGIVESGQLDSEVANGGKILLLTYTGGSAGEPLVVALYERFKVRANIVFGNIDFIQGAALGKLGVVLTGEKESVIQAEEYLKQNGVYVEELKNGLH